LRDDPSSTGDVTAAAPIAFVDDGLGNSSYLVGLGDGRGLVVDPSRHPGGYLRAAARLGLDLAYAVETHLHADFVSGARELGALGATLLVPGDGLHEFPARGLTDGEDVDLGGLTLRALATPGHTPEHLAYLLLDGSSPVALFSGGSLLVDSVARTDLVSPAQTEALARSLWRSIHDKLLTLPDDLAVYPTHGAGSFCSAPSGSDRVTTIGRERRANPLLAAPNEDAFVKQLLDDLGSYPPYFLRLRDVNRRGPHLYGPAEPSLPALGTDDVARLQSGGAWVIDVRPIDSFAAGHVPGSVSIVLRPQLASWLGWVVPFGEPIVFVAESGQDRAELVRQTRNIGYEALLGELDGGMETWRASGRQVETTRVTPVLRYEGTIVDVRQRNEYAAGHIPGAISAELGALTPEDLPPGPAAVMCGHGERALTGASLLARAGRRDVDVLTGGPEDWARAHGRLDTGS
jgi:glyoxylase-like metal-dependent hydrolase (beta-lactamase superfamily II)/rhodanese-related sulfurtransferase